MVPKMELTLAHLGGRTPGGDTVEELVQAYLKRTAAFTRCTGAGFRTVKAWEEWLARQQAKAVPVLVLLDSRGKQMGSEEFAEWLGTRGAEGARHIIFAIGPADGWDKGMLHKAQLQLSLGKFTMAHALARLVMAEQIYRACTILAGHPYHTGH